MSSCIPALLVTYQAGLLGGHVVPYGPIVVTLKMGWGVYCEALVFSKETTSG
jgi:hypothetical protein